MSDIDIMVSLRKSHEASVLDLKENSGLGSVRELGILDGNEGERPVLKYAPQDMPTITVLQLAKSLRELPNVSRCQPIARASVPLIKTTDTDTGFTFDIVLANQERVEALGADTASDAARVQQTAKRFPLFSPLVHFIQLLLHQHDLGELYSGGMNSFVSM